MMTYIEGKAEPNRLFYRDSNGNYIPFIGIKEISIRDDFETNPDHFYPSFTETGEFYVNMKLTRQSKWNLRNMFKCDLNVLRRRVRRELRRLEKERRERLKRGEK